MRVRHDTMWLSHHLLIFFLSTTCSYCVIKSFDFKKPVFTTTTIYIYIFHCFIDSTSCKRPLLGGFEMTCSMHVGLCEALERLKRVYMRIQNECWHGRGLSEISVPTSSTCYANLQRFTASWHPYWSSNSTEYTEKFQCGNKFTVMARWCKRV